MMKRKSTDPQINRLPPPPEFDESYGDFLKHGHGVWDTYHDEAGKEFLKLKPFHQKFFKDIIAACLSRFDKGQSIGVLNLQNVKIRDGAVILPLLSGSKSSRNPALACFELFDCIIRSKGDIPYKANFLVLLKILGTEKVDADLRIGFQSLLFHRFLCSSKENNDLVGNALEYLEKNATEMKSMFEKKKWDEAYKEWTRGRSYNIRKAIQGDKCLLDVYQYRIYLDTCTHVIQFFKNTFKHVNEHRDKRGKIKWSHEDMEINIERRFPQEIEGFFQFMWLSKVPMDFKKSELAIPHIRKCSGVVEDTSGKAVMKIKLESCQLALDHGSPLLPPTFNNLKCLELQLEACRCLQSIPIYLKLSPVLEHLKVSPSEELRNGEYCDNEKEDEVVCKWGAPDSVPICLTSHLKTICLWEFKCCPNELEVIKYLLQHGKALKELTIHNHFYAEMELQSPIYIWSKCSEFPRRSKNCKIVFQTIID